MNNNDKTNPNQGLQKPYVDIQINESKKSESQNPIIVDDNDSGHLTGDCPKCCSLPGKILACFGVCAVCCCVAL